MNCVICAIAKFENDYIQEWVDYHLNLGFTKIYLYDNNDIDGERIIDVVKQNFYNAKVEIIDVRGQKYVQKKVYNDFYHQYSFDWCAFIDLDEFITFSDDSGYKKIGDFLAVVVDFEAVHLNWKCYGDNGKVKKESKGVMERFPYPMKPLDFLYTYNFPENNHIKSILRKGLNIKWETNPHTPEGKFSICDEEGNELRHNKPFKPFTHNSVFIRHYYTKTIEEYCIKVIRQCADGADTFYNFRKFYRINRFTIKKYFVQKKLIKNYNISGYKNSLQAVFKEYLMYHFIFRYYIITKLVGKNLAKKKLRKP